MIISNGIVDEQRRKSTTIDTIFLVGFSLRRTIIWCDAMRCVYTENAFLLSFLLLLRFSPSRSIYVGVLESTCSCILLLVFLRSKMPWLESIMSFSSSLNSRIMCTHTFSWSVPYSVAKFLKHVQDKIAARRCSYSASLSMHLRCGNGRE